MQHSNCPSTVMPKQEVPPENPGTRKLTGTFSYPPPMCIGEMYMNARDRGGKDARSKGKQIQSGQMAGTVAFPGHFSAPTFLCSDGKLPYTENIKFKDVFKDKPEKKKLGFLTSDFPKREEFSNVMRTEQLRSCLKSETRVMNQAREKLEQMREEQGIVLDHGPLIKRDVMETTQTYLFDVVNRTIPTSLKLHRDDRQSKLFFAEERKRLTALKNQGKLDDSLSGSKGHLSEPAWIAISVGGRNLHVLCDPSGNVLASKDSGVDTHDMPEDVL